MLRPMSRLRDHALLAALLLGLLADLLLRAEGRPGLNAFLMAIAGATTLWLLGRTRAQPVSAESRWLVLGAVGFAALLMLRDAEALAVFDLLRSEEHTSELQSLMRISYAVFCLT